jgi:3-hydroxyacyl-[acyl-carrier-protein] dehydratase
MNIEKTNEDTWEGIFYFSPDDGIYRDHFPGYPVVPGSLIIQAFLQAATEAGIQEGCRSVKNFRFREFLTPGHYSFRMERQEDRLSCLIYRGAKKLVTGALGK